MNIVFRVNASNIEGSGHFNRTFLLAKFFKKKKFNIYFLSNTLHKKYIKLLNKNNFKYFISKKSSGNYQSNDTNFTIRTLKRINKKIDFIIVDCYRLGIEWEKKIIKYTKKLVVIDDIDRKHFCDIYISPFIKPKKKNIFKQNCKILTGLKYLIIKKIRFRKSNKKKRNILVYMGDSDNKKLTLKILKVIKKNTFKIFNFKILVGNSNLKKHEIYKNIKDTKNASFFNFQPLFAKFLNKIDIAIISGGSTIFELTAGGIPTLSICQNLEQYRLLKHNKILPSENIFKYNTLSVKNLEKFLEKKLLKNNIKTNKISFDFLGPKRIFKHF